MRAKGLNLGFQWRILVVGSDDDLLGFASGTLYHLGVSDKLY